MTYITIPSFTNYSISKDGVIKNKRGRILKSYFRSGYEVIALSKKGKQSTVRIHNLLSETWNKDQWIDQLKPNEEWKYIKGYENYIITSLGRVWSIKRNRWLSTPLIPPYYQNVTLCKDGIWNSCKLHTLVGRHFLKDYKDGLLILHDNEELPIPEVNHLSNLWVGTYKENVDDMYQKGRGGNIKKTKIKPQPTL